MFGIFESLLSKPDEAKELRTRLLSYYNQMIAPDGLGYQADAIEMFFEVFSSCGDTRALTIQLMR